MNQQAIKSEPRMLKHYHVFDAHHAHDNSMADTFYA
jgi:hypothetical protein